MRLTCMDGSPIFVFLLKIEMIGNVRRLTCKCPLGGGSRDAPFEYSLL